MAENRLKHQPRLLLVRFIVISTKLAPPPNYMDKMTLFEEQLEDIKKKYAAATQPRTSKPLRLIDPSNLTKKQQMEAQTLDILALKDRGKTNQQIAWKLGISKRTVQNRMAAVRKRVVPMISKR